MFYRWASWRFAYNLSHAAGFIPSKFKLNQIILVGMLFYRDPQVRLVTGRYIISRLRVNLFG